MPYSLAGRQGVVRVSAPAIVSPVIPVSDPVGARTGAPDAVHRYRTGSHLWNLAKPIDAT